MLQLPSRICLWRVKANLGMGWGERTIDASAAVFSCCLFEVLVELRVLLRVLLCYQVLPCIVMGAVLCQILLLYVMWYRVVLCLIVLCSAVLCCAVLRCFVLCWASHCVVLSYLIQSCLVLSCLAMLWVVPSYATFCTCSVAPCCVMLCHD